MSIGLKGPITRERLIDYAVAVAIGPAGSGDYNKMAAACKVCGQDLFKGEGVAGSIREIHGPQSSRCYLCRSCADWIGEHVMRWLSFVNKRKAEQV